MAHKGFLGRTKHGAVAQLGERRLCKADVRSSSLLGSTTSNLNETDFDPGHCPRQWRETARTSNN